MPDQDNDFQKQVHGFLTTRRASLSPTPKPIPERPIKQPAPAATSPAAPQPDFKNQVSSFLSTRRAPTGRMITDPQGRQYDVDAMAKKYNLDPDIAYKQIMQESRGDHNAVSRKGAIGFMQLMPETAKELGVDPHDPQQNLDGGMRLMQRLVQKYGGDYHKALAAYDAGEGRVDELGRVPDYPETQDYVNKIMGGGATAFTPRPTPVSTLGPGQRVSIPEPYQRGVPGGVKAYFDQRPELRSSPQGQQMLEDYSHQADLAKQDPHWGAQSWWLDTANRYLVAPFEKKEELVNKGLDRYYDWRERQGLVGAQFFDRLRGQQVSLEEEARRHPLSPIAKVGRAIGEKADNVVAQMATDPRQLVLMLAGQPEGVAELRGASGLFRIGADAGFTAMQGYGAYEGAKGAWQKFKDGDYVNGAADLFGAGIDGAFAALGTLSAIHKVRTIGTLNTLDAVAKKTYSRDWTDLPQEQRADVAESVLKANQSRAPILEDLQNAENNRDIAAIKKAYAKMTGKPFKERGPEPAPEGRVASQIKDLQDAYLEHQFGIRETPRDHVETEWEKTPDLESEKKQKALDDLQKVPVEETEKFSDSAFRAWADSRTKESYGANEKDIQSYSELLDGLLRRGWLDEAKALLTRAKYVLGEPSEVEKLGYSEDQARQLAEQNKGLNDKLFKAQQEAREKIDQIEPAWHEMIAQEVEAQRLIEDEATRRSESEMTEARIALDREELSRRQELEEQRKKTGLAMQVAPRAEMATRPGPPPPLPGPEIRRGLQPTPSPALGEGMGAIPKPPESTEPPPVLAGTPAPPEGILPHIERTPTSPRLLPGEESYLLDNLVEKAKEARKQAARARKTYYQKLGRQIDKAQAGDEYTRLKKKEADLAKEGQESSFRDLGKTKLEDKPSILNVSPKEAEEARQARYAINMLDEAMRSIQEQRDDTQEALVKATPAEVPHLNKAIQAADKELQDLGKERDEIHSELPPEERKDQERDRPAVEIPKKRLGNETEIKTARGSAVKVQYAVVDARQLEPSHDSEMNPNPNYPARRQPRNRNRAFSKDQFLKIAADFDPAMLGENFSGNNGAPVVGDDLYVDGGNMRSIVLKFLYKIGDKKSDEYKAWLASNASKFGVSPDVVAQMPQPVLVRVRRTPLESIGSSPEAFSRELNEPFEASMSSVETARADAQTMTPDFLAILHPGEDGNLFAAQNQTFVQRFFDQIISPADRSKYMMANGQINQDGVRRIQSAIFAKAFPGSEALLEKLSEDPDNNIRNATKAMLAAAPKFAQLSQLVEEGTLHDLRLSDDVVEAARKLSSLREQGQSVSDYLNQGKMYGEDISPAARELLTILSKNARRPANVADILNTYADDAMRAGRKDQGTMFGGGEAPDKAGLLRGAMNAVVGPSLLGEEAVAGTPPPPLEQPLSQKAEESKRLAPLPTDRQEDSLKQQIAHDEATARDNTVPKEEREMAAQRAKELKQRLMEIVPPKIRERKAPHKGAPQAPAPGEIPEPLTGKISLSKGHAGEGAVAETLGTQIHDIMENGKKVAEVHVVKAADGNIHVTWMGEPLQEGKGPLDLTAASNKFGVKGMRKIAAELKRLYPDAKTVEYTREGGIVGRNAAARGGALEAREMNLPETPPPLEPSRGKLRDQLQARNVETEGKMAPPPGDEGFLKKSEADKRIARLKSKFGRLQAGVDPQDLADIAYVMGHYVERGVRDFAAVAKKTLDDLGEWVKPHLEAAWAMVPRVAREAGQMNLFGEVKGGQETATAGGISDAPPPLQESQTARGPIQQGSGAEQSAAGGAPGGVPGPSGKAGAAGGRAARIAGLRDVRPTELAPQAERTTPPAWKEDAWKKTVNDARLPPNARIPTQRVYQHIADKLIFPGQDAIADFGLSELLDGSGGVVLGLPTGTGKSYLSSAIIRHLQESSPEQFKHILYMTASRKLVDDWVGIAKGFGVDADTEHYYDPRATGEPPKPGVYATTMDTARNRDGIEKFPWDLVVVDEAGQARGSETSQRGNLVARMGESGKKVMYLSATPFTNAAELQYLTKLGLWKGKTFDQWVRQFGISRSAEGSWQGHTNPFKLEKLRQQLVERGQFINQEKNFDGFNAHFAVVPLNPEQVTGVRNIDRAFAVAREYYQRRGNKRMMMVVSANKMNYLKHYIESTRIPATIELARRAMNAGYQVPIFSETHSEVNTLYKPLIEPDKSMNGFISKILPKIEGFVPALKEAFGEDFADYSGGYSKAREKQLEGFQSGQKKVFYTTYAAGGLGLSLHDTAGDAPRFSVYHGLPWSGYAFEQGAGRTWRYGTKSDTNAAFLLSNVAPEVKLVVGRIVPRLDALNAVVNGVDFRSPLTEGLSNANEALSYDHGDDVKASGKEFTDLLDTSKVFKSHKQIDVADAKTAIGPNKGMKVRSRMEPPPSSEGKATSKEPKSPSSGTFFAGVDPIEAAKRVSKELKDTFKRDSGLPSDPILDKVLDNFLTPKAVKRDLSVALPRAEDKQNFVSNVASLAGDQAASTKGNSAPVVDGTFKDSVDWLKKHGGKEAYEFARAGKSGNVSMWQFALRSGRDIINSVTNKAGMPELGTDLNKDILEYQAQRALLAGEWMGRIMDWSKEHKITPENMAEVWDMKEGEREVKSGTWQEKAVKDLEQLFYDVQDKAVDAGVQLERYNEATGKTDSFDFPKDKRPNYMPRIYDEEVFKFGSKKRDEIVGSIMRKRGISKVQAEAYLDSHTLRDVPLSGNLERTRQHDIEGYEKTLHSIYRYLNGAAEAIGRTKVFGQKREGLDGKIVQLGDASARRQVREIFDDLLTRQPFYEGPRNFLGFASDWVALTKMTFTAIPMMSHSIKSAMFDSSGVPEFVRSFAKVLTDYPSARRAAIESGAIAPERTLDFITTEYGTSHRFGDKVLKMVGVSGLDQFSRVMANTMAENFLNKWALPKLMDEPQHTYRHVARDLMGVPEKLIDEAIENGKWSDEAIKRAGARWANTTQGTNDPTELPPMWRLRAKDEAGQHAAALLRTSVMLKAYVYRNGKFFGNLLMKEAMRGNFRPWIPFLMLAPAGGELLLDLQELSRGRTERAKELGQSETYHPFTLLSRLADDAGMAVGASLASNMIESFDRFKGDKRSALARFALGPYLWDLIQGTTSALSMGEDIQKGQLEKIPGELNKAAKEISPAYRLTTTPPPTGGGRAGNEYSGGGGGGEYRLERTPNEF